MKLYFITGNKKKLLYAQQALQGTDIELVQKNLDPPEIQSTDVCEIACFSAQWAVEKIQQPVVVTDVGYYIQALNGFPGPFVKYINSWLNAEGILKLMEGKEDRLVAIRSCLAYCAPKQEVVSFEIEVLGSIATVAPIVSSSTEMDRITIPQGQTEALCLLSTQKQDEYWIKTEYFWHELATYLKSLY